jgi:hypothetical protein
VPRGVVFARTFFGGPRFFLDQHTEPRTTKIGPRYQPKSICCLRT